MNDPILPKEPFDPNCETCGKANASRGRNVDLLQGKAGEWTCYDCHHKAQWPDGWNGVKA